VIHVPRTPEKRLGGKQLFSEESYGRKHRVSDERNVIPRLDGESRTILQDIIMNVQDRKKGETSPDMDAPVSAFHHCFMHLCIIQYSLGAAHDTHIDSLNNEHILT
jgi:hypothetical protein